MSSILFSLPELYASYKKWVSENPQKASDFETTTKWLSYFIAGRIHNSHVVSELVYCLSNLLVLFNDRLITKVRQLEIPKSSDSLKLWLTIVNYSEVFFELSAKKLWGTTGKWLIILAIQTFKCISRLLLVYYHKESVVLHPPIPMLERRLVDEKNSLSNDATVAELARAQFDSVSFTLRRSGRVIRKVNASPDPQFRNWKPLQKDFRCENNQTIEQALAGYQLFAETLYILKPMAHLSTVFCFGSRSWKPWMISLALDLLSLHLYKTCKKTKNNSLTEKQHLQISKRSFALLLYLLRSPFYDEYSKEKLNSLLLSVGNNVPLAGYICLPLARYLPFWQSNYFYMWST